MNNTMNKVMNRVSYAKNQTQELVKQAEIQAIAYTDPVKLRRVFQIATIVAMMATVLMSVAGATSTIKDGINNGMFKVWKLLKAIVLPLGAVVIAACFVYILFDGERGMEKGKKYLLRTIIVVAAVYFAPVIVSNIGGWFNHGGDAGWKTGKVLSATDGD